MAEKIPTEELLKALRKLRDDLGKTPTKKDMTNQGKYGTNTYRRRFGSWTAALNEIDEEPVRRPYTTDELVAKLQDLADELGRTPTSHEVSEHTKHTHRVYQDRFGSWNGALEAAGLEINMRRNVDSTVECSNCGSTLERFPSIVEEQDHFFCDSSCMGEWESREYSGEGNPRYSKYEEECLQCGESVLRPHWIHKRSEKTFCSPQCRGKWVKESGHMRGENSPNWKGGTSYQYYGAEWRYIREEILERDGYECKYCGLTDAESQEQYDCSLHIHHRTPVRNYDSVEDAHDRDNLVTLCSRCHKMWDHLPVQFETPELRASN